MLGEDRSGSSFDPQRLSFEFILDLVSQAIAWSYVGAKVIGLAPLSLNTAYEMNKFIADFDAARARAAAPGATAADRTELAALLVRLRDAATLLAIAPESAEGDSAPSPGIVIRSSWSRSTTVRTRRSKPHP